MINVEILADLIADLKKDESIPLSTKCWKAAVACEGWPYVYSAWGAECTPAERQKRYGMTDNDNIVKNCQVLSGKKGSCDGCKFYPDRFRTRCFDCRGFTDYILKEVAGFDLYGDTVSVQWGTGSNWCAKGKIGVDAIPRNVLVCLFIYKNDKWTHTGFYLNGATCECSSNVQVFQTMKSNRWTHWAVPACFTDDWRRENMARPGYAMVTAANGKPVNLRAEPTKKAKVLIQVKVGEEVKLEPEPESAWEYVSYKGKTGWMMREFLQE